MTFNIYTRWDDGTETVIEEAHKGPKGKPAEWPTREAAERYVADCKKYAYWTGGRKDIHAEFIIREAGNAQDV